MNLLFRFALLLSLLGSAGSAAAYIGPGAGISFLGSLVTTVSVVLLAVAAVLFWPIRYLFRRLRPGKVEQKQEAESD